MKFFRGITRFFYTLILILLGASLILIALKVISKDGLIDTINLIYSQTNFRLVTGFAGLLLIAVSLLVIQLTLNRFEREKTIAFDNPDGRVTVSLTAIEDLMKRMSKQISEIKDLKPKVTATKKGIVVDVKASLYSEMSIPNITEKVQSVVKNRIQSMLGIEEPITVRIHINKIASKDEPRKKKVKEPKKEEVPAYHGIEYSEE